MLGLARVQRPARARVVFGVFTVLWAAAAVLAVLMAAAVLAATAGAADRQPDRQPQVVGGDSVPHGKYPYMASIQLAARAGGPRADHVCGATLINPRAVLTAAHCARHVKTPRNWRVVVGVTSLSTRQGQARGIAAVRIHPNNNPRTYAHDVAIIKLDRPVSGIRPVALDPAGINAYERPGRVATVIGWGSTREASKTPVETLREARVPIASDAATRRAYGTNYRPAIMLAAGKEGADACYGDSGGPLLARAGSGWRQIGVTSHGYGCARAGLPGVYAELSNTGINNWVLRAAR